MGQQIRFCVAPDGVRVAYAVHGSGPPIVRVATWLTHLEFDWETTSPEFALGYRFDVVLRGRESTPFEETR